MKLLIALFVTIGAAIGIRVNDVRNFIECMIKQRKSSSDDKNDV